MRAIRAKAKQLRVSLASLPDIGRDISMARFLGGVDAVEAIGQPITRPIPQS
jgi:hypothetical protein